MTFQIFMLAVALVLVLEGLGPLLFPNKWRRYLNELSHQNQQVIQRLGGALVTAGVVLWVIFA
ncbi:MULTISPECIES: DUF2065 domain-containing protein [Shewanella]|jgi:uncharacterized protein YjeT (DUF2065 family)|uniref:DUF2065 domain-containing protein n=1 Tax=Shewanella TaxID=22 RepID=UPI0018E3CD76|nr:MULTISPECIES: DUF2065 domain-containing protein [Shewanella]MBP8118983.1 DUF2065 domain-containing protein [Shewanella sp.]GCF89759.1 hypothetical protein SMBr_20030 [Shewanella sp. M-Br]MBI1676543.1 DUF2065 domain-containing protein [Shewanella sp. DW31]MCU7986163.1 DUF2065 domain-containing protein [Shewanella sp. SW24]MCU8012245.1 DUF2065 domain-containing protein [Shewanella sp. SM74]